MHNSYHIKTVNDFIQIKHSYEYVARIPCNTHIFGINESESENMITYRRRQPSPQPGAALARQQPSPPTLPTAVACAHPHLAHPPSRRLPSPALEEPLGLRLGSVTFAIISTSGKAVVVCTREQ